MNGVKKFVQAAQHNAQQIETTRQARAAKNPNMNEALPPYQARGIVVNKYISGRQG